MTRSSARVSVTRDMAAPADVAWDLISDVTRMGEWSPETTSCRWEGDGGAEVGATFSGDNTSGSHSWTTKCVVTVCEPGRTFAFEARSLRLKIAGWQYHFEPTELGCQATESWIDQRNWLFAKLEARLSGVHDRAAHNRETMTESLDRLARAAEESASA